MSNKRHNLQLLIKSLLEEHQLNCNDIRGCNGEYLSEDVVIIIDLFKQLEDLV